MKKVLIICQCATNKGDRAIAEYLIEKLQQDENMLITLSTTEPKLWQNAKKNDVRVIGMGWKSICGKAKNKLLGKILHKIDTLYYEKLIYPDIVAGKVNEKRLMKISGEFIDEVSSADLVIVTGGHHITSIRNKNALFAITYDIALAGLFAKKYVLWSQTIGPLEFDNDKVKNFFAKLLKGAECIYLRDENSRECVREIIGEIPSNVRMTYDSVFGFGNEEYTPYNERENKVGISIFNGLKKAFNTYDALAAMLDFFVSEGMKIEFFKMECGERETEDIKKVISLMKRKQQADISIYPFETATREHLKEISTCKYFIGYKTHSVIMALTTATPLAAVCYHKKTRDFMEMYSLGEYALNDEEITKENAVKIAQNVIADATEMNIRMMQLSKETAVSIAKDLRTVIND